MMGGAQHRFSERYIVVIPGFQGNLFRSGGNLERSINVDVPTVIHEEPAQEPQLVGGVSLYGRDVQRSGKSLSNPFAAPFGVHHGQGQRPIDLQLPARVPVLISEESDRSLRPYSAFDQQGQFEKQLR